MAGLSQHGLCWAERRICSTDRRQRPTRSLHYHGVTGRRVLQRRKTDLGQMSTDCFDKPVWFAALAIILFSVMDFILTTLILEAGGTELNWLMNHVIQQSSAVFFATKYSLTALAVLILLSHHQHVFFRAIKVNNILYGLALLYFVLFIYEISIIASIYR